MLQMTYTEVAFTILGAFCVAGLLVILCLVLASFFAPLIEEHEDAEQPLGFKQKRRKS